jgi:hypothetical protein
LVRFLARPWVRTPLTRLMVVVRCLLSYESEEEEEEGFWRR